MKDIVITSDSTCDLSADLIAANDIRIMPLSVMLGGKTFRDGVNIAPADIFRYVDETGELPKTAAPSVEEYENFFRPFTDEGKTVIHFNISSKASGSHGFALAAAQKIGGDRVYVVDSHALSTGQGLLVLKACDLRREGRAAAAARAVTVTSAALSMPVADSMAGLTARMYAMAAKVESPAISSVPMPVPRLESLNALSKTEITAFFIC